jgi:hypothetical protein
MIEVSKQDPHSKEFREMVSAIADRTVALQSQVEALHYDVKRMHSEMVDLAAATQAVVASNRSLDKTLTELVILRTEDAEAITNMQKSINQMRDVMPELLAPLEMKLQELLRNVYDLPTLVLVYPAKKSTLGKMNPMNLFQTSLNIQFICEYSRQLAPKVYTIKSTKEWVSYKLSYPHHDIYSLLLFLTCFCL